MWRFAFLLMLSVGVHAEVGGPGSTTTGSTTRWGSVLNPRGDAPLGAFKAVYINTQNPRQIIATEVVPAIAINYPWDDFHGIKSEDFGAYWVGRVEFRKDETRTIEVSQSWSKARIFIDGELVHEGGADKRISHDFRKGKHLIEVEYVNNWHTTSFRVAFKGVQALLGSEQIRQQLLDRNLADADVHYAGVYESSAKDLTIKLNVVRSGKPVVLVLNSYDSVSWVVNEAAPGNVRAIIYSSSKPGSDVSGVDPRKVLVQEQSGGIGTYELKPRCSCTAAHYHCENSGNLLSTIADVERVTGAQLKSFNGAYSIEAFPVPGMAITEVAREQDRAASEQEKRNREQCARQGNPDFDKMFDEPSPKPKVQ